MCEPWSTQQKHRHTVHVSLAFGSSMTDSCSELPCRSDLKYACAITRLLFLHVCHSWARDASGRKEIFTGKSSVTYKPQSRNCGQQNNLPYPLIFPSIPFFSCFLIFNIFSPRSFKNQHLPLGNKFSSLYSLVKAATSLRVLFLILTITLQRYFLPFLSHKWTNSICPKPHGS